MNTEKENMTNLYGIPMKLYDVMLDSFKTSRDLSIDYWQSVEKNQREYMKTMYDTFNVSLPGESKFWELQGEMVKNWFGMCDKFAGVWK